MPRYLVERTYTVDMDKLTEVATRSKAIGYHRYPEIVWEQDEGFVEPGTHVPNAVFHLGLISL